MPLSVDPEEVKMIRDVSSFVGIADLTNEVWFSQQATFAKYEDIFPSGVPGHRFVNGDEETFIFPGKLKRSGEQVDFIVATLKHRKDQDYYVGVPVDKVINFQAPADPSTFNVWSLLQTVKVTLSSNISLEALQDTETQPLSVACRYSLGTPLRKQRNTGRLLS